MYMYIFFWITGTWFTFINMPQLPTDVSGSRFLSIASGGYYNTVHWGRCEAGSKAICRPLSRLTHVTPMGHLTLTWPWLDPRLPCKINYNFYSWPIIILTAWSSRKRQGRKRRRHQHPMIPPLGFPAMTNAYWIIEWSLGLLNLWITWWSRCALTLFDNGCS